MSRPPSRRRNLSRQIFTGRQHSSTCHPIKKAKTKIMKFSLSALQRKRRKKLWYDS